MHLLGIDYGRRKVGLAMGDEGARLASPWKSIPYPENDEALVQWLADVALQEAIDQFVVGVPMFADGTPSKQGERHLAFVKLLQETTSLPVQVVDESFTSKESLRIQREEGTSVTEDALSAMLILQEYFDRL